MGNYDTTSYQTALFATLGTYFIILAVIYVVTSILLAAMFKKAGIEGWKAWVPFVNGWTLLEMGGQRGAFIFFAFIPFVGSILVVVFQIMALVEINRRFRQSGGMLALAILLTPVYYGIMGYGSAQWHGGAVQPAYAGGYAQPAPSPYGAPAPVTSQFAAPAPYSAPAPVKAPAQNEGVSAASANIAAGGLTAILVTDLTPYSALNAQAKANNAEEARAISTSIAGSFGSRTSASAPLLMIVDSAIAADQEVSAAIQYINSYGGQVNARVMVLPSESPAPASPASAWD